MRVPPWLSATVLFYALTLAAVLLAILVRGWFDAR